MANEPRNGSAEQNDPAQSGIRNTTVPISYEGRSFTVHTFGPPDHISMELAGTKTFYELELLRKAFELHIPGTSIIDVGAFFGNHTTFFSAILNAPVYCFEPNPRAVELLQANISANDLKNVTVIQSALYSAPGHGTLRTGPPENLGQSSVAAAESGGDVEVRTLDSIGFGGPVGIIKVDVEQAELEVLKGARSTIQTFLPHVFVECQTQGNFVEICEYFLEMNYRPIARYCYTPTYLFSPVDEATRLRQILRRLRSSDTASNSG